MKPSLEVLVFEAVVLKLRHGYSFLLSWRMLAGAATHVVGFRPKSGHLQATNCMRWQLDADYTTIGSQNHKSSQYPFGNDNLSQDVNPIIFAKNQLAENSKLANGQFLEKRWAAPGLTPIGWGLTS